ncbi:MAG: thioredoxin family protein [Odoribacteraceae bacterium]|jgi:thiol-disulfide isomerase/thioredoxin|nr:thioredoxin family protein [Odoribacteraceae bacterium]
MKNIFLFLALSLLPLAAAAQGINFEELTLDAALAKAKLENKHVFIDGYTAWCGPCKMMDAEIFPMKEIGDYFNPRFVCVKYDMERSDDGKALGERFGVKAYPTFIILDSDNEMRHLFAGGILSLEFIDKVNVAFNGEKAFGNLQKRYEAGERDKKLVSAYIQALQGTYTRDVKDLVEEFYNSLPDDEKICEECLFLFDDHAAFGSERAAFLIANLDKFRAAAGRDKVDEVVRKKYIDRYTRLIRGERPATVETVEELRGQTAAMNLSGTGVLAIYETATLVKAGQDDGRALLEMIKAAAPLAKPAEVDMLLYTLLSHLKDTWDKETLDELLSLVSNDRARDYIRSSARL